jgi:hypothetical protein
VRGGLFSGPRVVWNCGVEEAATVKIKILSEQGCGGIDFLYWPLTWLRGVGAG